MTRDGEQTREQTETVTDTHGGLKPYFNGGQRPGDSSLGLRYALVGRTTNHYFMA